MTAAGLPARLLLVCSAAAATAAAVGPAATWPQPVLPRGVMQPRLAAAATPLVISPAPVKGQRLDEPTPALQDANGTWHLFATLRREGAAAAAGEGGESRQGDAVVHYASRDLLSWHGGELVLRASARPGPTWGHNCCARARTHAHTRTRTRTHTTHICVCV